MNGATGSAMQPVSSVMAFVARYARGAERDEQAIVILGSLTEVEREVVESLVAEQDAAARLRRLAARTGEAWSRSRFDRVALLVLTRLGRALAQRGLLRP